MQILLQALLGETEDAKTPGITIPEIEEGKEKDLFGELFNLLDRAVETSDDTANVELSDEIGSNLTNTPTTLPEKEIDVLLPSLGKEADLSERSMIDITPKSVDDIGIGAKVPDSATLSTDVANRGPSATSQTPSALDQRSLPGPDNISLRPDQDLSRQTDAKQISSQVAVIDTEAETQKTPSPGERKPDVVQSGQSPISLASNTSGTKETSVDASPITDETLKRGIDTSTEAGKTPSIPSDLPSDRSQRKRFENELNAKKQQKIQNASHTETNQAVNSEPLENTKPKSDTPIAQAQKSVVFQTHKQPIAHHEKLHERAFSRDSGLLDVSTGLSSGEADVAQRKSSGFTRPEPIARPVVQQVVQMALSTNGNGTFEVRLQPEELGRLRITMTQAEAGMVVQVYAERPETLDLLRRNIDILGSELRDQGFEDPTFLFDQNSDNSEQRQDDERETTDSPSSIAPVQIENRPEYQSAENGRLDIRL